MENATRAVAVFFSASFGFLCLGQANVQTQVRESRFDGEVLRENTHRGDRERHACSLLSFLEGSARDHGLRRIREQAGSLDTREEQIRAITASFARRTEPGRARRLAALCYLKTLGTPFMPIDIAEIALAETGSYGLSNSKVSRRGARGVWQIMPCRARSHGYAPREMDNDHKCAEAAVRELACKLAMANGNLTKAKKLYCGTGREANAYEVIRRQYRREIMDDLTGARDCRLPAYGHSPRLYATLVNQQ